MTSDSAGVKYCNFSAPGNAIATSVSWANGSDINTQKDHPVPRQCLNIRP